MKIFRDCPHCGQRGGGGGPPEEILIKGPSSLLKNFKNHKILLTKMLHNFLNMHLRKPLFFSSCSSHSSASNAKNSGFQDVILREL